MSVPLNQRCLLQPDELRECAMKELKLMVPEGSAWTQLPAPPSLYVIAEAICPCVTEKSQIIVPGRMERVPKISLRQLHCAVDGMNFLLWLGNCSKCAKCYFSFLNMTFGRKESVNGQHVAGSDGGGGDRLGNTRLLGALEDGPEGDNDSSEAGSGLGGGNEGIPPAGDPVSN